MKRAIFSFLAILILSMGVSGCNFSPGAMLGDVNDDPWNWNTSSEYNSNNYGRYSTACMTREIQEVNTNRGTCTMPGRLSNRLAKVTGNDDRLEIELRKDDADDNFQITSLIVIRDSFFGASRYTEAKANCTEDKGEARTFSQRYVCTLPPGAGFTTDRFHSMLIVNQKCGSYGSYTLPRACSTKESYTVKYGSEYFPTF